jgi:putative oligomerization/nucleic acid binding protein
MRSATVPSWTFVMLIVMGLGFTAGAVAFFLFAPAPAGAIVGGIWLLMGTAMEFFSVRALRGRRNEERIRREGTRATATLLEAKTTGWTINGVPQWALRLRIEGAGAAYEAKLKLLTYTPPPSGAVFTVRIDPLRRDHVVLADDPPAPGAADAAGPGFLIGGAQAAGVEAAVAAALRQAGLGQGERAVVNPDGSRTITSVTTTFDAGGEAADASAEPGDAAETVRLLADLDRMHASGALGDAEFDALKRKLLGEG